MPPIEQLLSSIGLDIRELASRFGLNTDQTKSAMESLMPAVLGGFQKGGVAGELSTVTDSGIAMDQPTAEAGNDILARLFGSKDASCQVADQAASHTQGVSSSIMKFLLPIVAAMVAKYFAAQGGASSGSIGQMLESLMGGAGGSSGLGSLGDMLEKGRNPLDALLGGNK